MGYGSLEHFFEPRLLVSIPCTGNVPRWQPTCLGSLTKTVASLIAERTIDSVTPFIGIGGCAKESSTALMGVGQCEVVCIVLSTHLEHLISIVGNFTKAVLHTPAAEPVRGSVYAVHLHTAIKVHNMVVSIHVIIRCRGTEVPRIHLVGMLVHDTSVWQDGYWYGKHIIGVSIEEAVIVADGGIVHGAVGIGLVGVITNTMVAGGLIVLERTEHAQFYLLDRLVF